MELILYSDQYFMYEALKEAQKALQKDEVPIGAIVVINNKIIGRAYNLTQTLIDTTAHAEMQAITSATNFIGGKYLKNATIYITLEPCVMCAGAIFWSQISKVVFGAYDSKQGFLKYQNVLIENNLSLIHKKLSLFGGVLENECSELLKKFFENKRENKN